MVAVAASMAQAASMALPPAMKVFAPAVAASGLPVMAIHWVPCSSGFWVTGGPLTASGARVSRTSKVSRRIMRETPA